VKYLYKLLDSGLIDFVEIREWIEFYHNFIPEVAQNIQQRQTLTLKGMIFFFQNNRFKNFDFGL